jgi:hypothetical protein
MRSCTSALAFLLAISQAAYVQDSSIFDAGLDKQMGLVFSPDGKTAFWASWNGRRGWESAVPLDRLNSSGSDLMPRMHPDGETLYFTTAHAGGAPK